MRCIWRRAQSIRCWFFSFIYAYTHTCMHIEQRCVCIISNIQRCVSPSVCVQVYIPFGALSSVRLSSSVMVLDSVVVVFLIVLVFFFLLLSYVGAALLMLYLFLTGWFMLLFSLRFYVFFFSSCFYFSFVLTISGPHAMYSFVSGFQQVAFKSIPWFIFTTIQCL